MSLLQFGGAYSFGTSQRKVFEVKNQNEPSPLDYQKIIIQIDKTKGQSFTKQSKLEQNLPISPPLGHYKIQYKQIHKEVPGKSMLKKQKQNIIQDKLGPGSYNIVNERIQSITHTFGYKISEPISQNQVILEKQLVNLDDKKKLKPNFSKSDRNLNKITNNYQPGPGHYSTDIGCLTAKNSISFGKQKRSFVQEKSKEKIPGPGTYENILFDNQNSIKNEKICYFGGRTQDYELKYRSQFPSPGKYDPSLPKVAQQISFVKAKRDIQISNKNYPGPGNYDLQYKKNGQQFSIGNMERSVNILNSKDNPGPGQYLIKSKAIEGFSQSLQSRRKENFQQNNNPGPGMYNVQQLNPGRYSLIGTSDHLNNQDVLYKTALGPGQYNNNLNFDGPQYSIGKLFKQKQKDYKSGIIKYIKEFEFKPDDTVGFIPKYLSHEVRKDS